MEKNTKKILTLGVLGLFVIMFALQFVAAAAPTQGDIEQFSQDTIDTMAAFFNPILGWLVGVSSTGSEFAVRVLAFLMVAIIIFGVLDSVKIFGEEKTWINYTLGIIVATIGVRFLPEGLLTAMTAPSSALVAVLFLGIPFLTFFFITKKMENATVRRIMWTMYAFLIGTIAGYNTYYTTDATVKAAFVQWAWIYVVFALVSLAMGFFDGTIQRFLGTAAGERYINTFAKGKRIALNEELKDTIRQLADSSISPEEKSILEKQRARILKAISALEKSEGKVSEVSAWKQFWIAVGALIVVGLIVAFAARFF